MFFITGTGTGVGKTFVTALLLRNLRAARHSVVGMKPLCCGDRADAEILVEASGHVLTLNQCNPVWLRPPTAPYAASMMEGREIDLDLIRAQHDALRAQFSAVLVEGVGGWRVPIRRDYFMANLAADLGHPILLVAANQLGALNHILLTLDAIHASGLHCAGIILNNLTGQQDAAIFTNRSVLEELTEVPILLEISPHQQKIAPTALQSICRAAG